MPPWGDGIERFQKNCYKFYTIGLELWRRIGGKPVAWKVRHKC